MAILVTGAAGFIGAHVAKALLDAGESVIGIDNLNAYYPVALKRARLAQLIGPHAAFRFVHADFADREQLDTATASVAKFWTTEMQFSVLDNCVQLFGGYGYMREYPISRMFTDARVQRIYGGANEVMKEVIARSL